MVKSPDARCTTRWQPGTITGLNSATNVEVDGIPRHIADLRLVPDVTEEMCDIDLGLGHPPMDNILADVQDVRPHREVRPPNRWGNNIYDI